MLFKLLKVESKDKNEEILNFIDKRKELNVVFFGQNETLYFSLPDEPNVKIVPLFFDNNLFFLLNTFDIGKIEKIKLWFEHITNSPFSIFTFSNDFFKKMLDENDKIVEINAVIHDFITDEISISGSDLHSSEFYETIIKKGEIKKIVLYLDEPEQALIKVFYDGRISIIPELDFAKVKSLMIYLLKRLNIEKQVLQ